LVALEKFGNKESQRLGVCELVLITRVKKDYSHWFNILLIVQAFTLLFLS